MKRKKRLKLKKPFVILLRLIVLILLLGFFSWCFYLYQINFIKKIGYSTEASKNILFGLKKDFVVSVGKNLTLNAAFESDD
ncbi:MAG: hypothetical protein J6A29_04385, partial [Clostridia bacterium]|nr:hypothetical protein [Clostridia bacterium]